MRTLSPVLGTASPGVAVACVAGAYLLGTFPSAWLATRGRGVDPSAAGSGNPGATNVYRTAGRRAGVLTLAGDVFKGAAAAGLGWAVGGHGLGVACGVAAVLGHVAPLNRLSRGGKGVATGAGMALVLFPLAALMSAAMFAVVTGFTRTVSLGSMAAVAILPAAAGALGAPGREVAALAGCALVVIARHRANIGRLWRGEEPHLGTAA
ncbi:MAG TPA: glycerol-3-phosphate acyltransferase [Acidimicrobiales bacterium]|nr:glycerol-3-phosphate acyltransferase [Acidimicrobiales bacterium]